MSASIAKPILFPSTIAGSLPKPAWLAEPNKLWAPWRSQGDELAQAKDDATLLALKLQEDAGIDIVSDGEQARQHFVHGFLEAIEGIDFDKPRRDGHPQQPLQGDVPDGHRPAAAALAACMRAKRGWRAPTRAQAQIHPARPDDHRRHHRRRALRRPRKDGDGVCGAAQRRSARARRRRRRRDPVRRAGLQRLHGRSRRLGHRGAAPRHRRRRRDQRRAHLLRLRHRRQHRVEADARRRMAAVREILPGAGAKPYRPGFARVHQLACADERAQTARRQGRRCSASSTSPPTTIETPEEVAAVIAQAADYVPKEKIIACTNCGMAPMRRDIAAKKLEALAKGAALARAKLG